MNGENSAQSMQISAHLNLSSVNGTASANRPKTASASDADGDKDSVTLTDLTSLKGSLESTAASRPDVVAKARQLIADPSYPNATVTGQVSQFLANKILGQAE